MLLYKEKERKGVIIELQTLDYYNYKIKIILDALCFHYSYIGVIIGCEDLAFHLLIRSVSRHQELAGHNRRA